MNLKDNKYYFRGDVQIENINQISKSHMDKKRIAVLFSGDIYKIRGEFTAIHNRIKALQKEDDILIDAYVFGEFFDKFTNFIKRAKQKVLKSAFELDNVTYNCFWYKRSHIDNITHKLLKRSTNVEINRVKNKAEHFKGYDLIYCHSLYTAHIGLILKQKYNIPFICMWHGSSIHTLPFQDRNTMKRTKRILEKADMNLFVSDELLATAKRITDNLKGEVSYNGIDTDIFYRLKYEERLALRKEKGIAQDDKCIAFVGNCLPIKNVQYLPILFSTIVQNCNKARFFIFGKGDFAKHFNGYDLNITYANEITNKDMPIWYNCMDLIVMPSINEGLPMTCLEATACGTSFVGSRVGAIADVVGVENTIEHNPDFNEAFATLCVKLLNNIERNIELPTKFKLTNIIKKESEILKTVIKNN
mgnify:CR=1 FL=1